MRKNIGLHRTLRNMFSFLLFATPGLAQGNQVAPGNPRCTALEIKPSTQAKYFAAHPDDLERAKCMLDFYARRLPLSDLRPYRIALIRWVITHYPDINLENYLDQGLDVGTEAVPDYSEIRAKLDQFFNTPYTAKGICRDCTGVVGQYVQGNQPDQQVAYYYDWTGEAWKTQRLTRQIMSTLYGSDRSGFAFPGMDDQGSTSSWYVMSALGFYPVDPSTPDYILGSPLFNEATIHMGNGHDFTIVARNNSEKNIYIQSATLNGKPWNKPWFSHSDIAGGGKLVLTMGPEPNKQWAN
ncbi:MAG TPA: glycoside hydrolase domain-containing protein [Edaphobacter sp.]|nr:glycoside hydrolase domain-containing protein [Edaphobacter sp.]